MIDIKKYLTTIGLLVAILILATVIINIFISSLAHIFGLLINTFSTIYNNSYNFFDNSYL